MRPGAVALFLFCSSGVALAAMFTVDTTDGGGADVVPGDGVCSTASGDCSLLAAVMEANASPGSDTIAFDIAGGGVATITPNQVLPVISDPVVIDGSTQGCPGPGPCIELLGTLVPDSNGLAISAGQSTVRGLAIGLFFDGIRLAGGDGNVIESNFLGTDATGTVARGNVNGIGIRAGSTNNLVGGATPEAGNRIAASSSDGIDVSTSDNQILSNVIGGDDFIPEALGNQFGIRVTVAGGQVIGAPGAGNVISGNGTGIWLAGSNVSEVVVQSNCIGPILGCTTPFGNEQQGILIFSSPGNTIGGLGPGEGNVIGSNGVGLWINLDFADGNLVAGNFIGTDSTATLSLGNTGPGILILSGADDNLIGGAEPGAGNVISKGFDSGVKIDGGDDNTLQGNTISLNLEHGVEVLGGVGNTIRGNGISANGGLGIDLGNDGVTPNDPGDADTGPNGLQNYPVLVSAFSNGVSTAVNGVLDSTPNTLFHLEFFTNVICDNTLYGEGASLLGVLDVTTNASGLAPFNASFATDAQGLEITATAADPDGSTSEFSNCRTVFFDSDLGACCLGAGECALTSELDCDGVYQGDGTSCSPGVCADQVPAASEWGLILLTLILLALGATFRPHRSSH